MRLTLLIVPLLMLGCAGEPGTGRTGDSTRGPLGKADNTGSCRTPAGDTLCGEQGSGSCWCDEECASYDDCCADYEATCTGEQGPLDQLAALLQTEGAIVMPPMGVEHNANEHRVHVSIVPMQGDVATFMRDTVDRLATEYLDTGSWYDDREFDGFLALSHMTDGVFQLQHGYSTNALGRAHLLDDLVRPDLRAAVAQLLPLSRHYTWFLVYDIGAEVYGHDIVIVYGASRALILKVEFVHA